MNVDTIAYVTKNMMKSIIISAIVMVISISIMTVNQTAGIIVMMLYSSFMVVKSSGKEMPLNTFTAILPGLMSLVIFFVMLGLIDVDNETMPLIGIGLGIIPGVLMARGHKVYKKNGKTYAKRTFFYVFIWVLSLLFTQGSTLAGMREITDFGFLLNGFSTAMMVVLSVILFSKINTNNQTLSAHNVLKGFVLAGIIFSVVYTPVNAYTIEGQMNEKKMKEVGNYVAKDYISMFKSKNIIIGSDGHSNKWLQYDILTTSTPTSHCFSRWKYKYTTSTRIQVSLSSRLFFHLYYKRAENQKYVQNRKKSNKNWCNGMAFKPHDLIVKNPQYYSLDNQDGSRGSICVTKIMICSKEKQYYKNSTSDPRDYTNNIYVIWTNGDWTFEIDAVNSPEHPSSLGNNFINSIAQVIPLIIERIKTIRIIDTPQNKPNSTNSIPSSNSHFTEPSRSTYTHPHSHQELEFSDDEIAAGALAALAMLLASLGMNATMLAAQASASVSESGEEEEENDSADTSDTGAPLTDPYDGEELPEEDGMYWDGYGERWMTRDEAEHFVSELNEEKSEEESTREQELEAFEEQNERERVQRNVDREQQLRDEGNIYDEDQDAWVKDPNYVAPRTDLDKFYDSVQYLDDHSHQLSDKRNESIDRILSRIGYNNDSIDSENLTEKNMDTLSHLTKAVNNIIHSEYESKIAEEDAATFKDYEDVAEGIKYVGKQCSETVELYLTDGITKGAITSFIYETAENHDKPFTEIIKNSTYRSAETYVGNFLGDKVTSIPGKIAVNTAFGSAVERKDQYMDGKGYDNEKAGLKGIENAGTDYIRDKVKDFSIKTAPQSLRNIRADSMLYNLGKQSIHDLRIGARAGAIKYVSDLAEESISRFKDLRTLLKKI